MALALVTIAGRSNRPSLCCIAIAASLCYDAASPPPRHDLRQAAASLMISAGWNVKRVQTEMCHADPAFTLRVYGHLFRDDVERDRALLDRPRTSCCPTLHRPNR